MNVYCVLLTRGGGNFISIMFRMGMGNFSYWLEQNEIGPRSKAKMAHSNFGIGVLHQFWLCAFDPPSMAY